MEKRYKIVQNILCILLLAVLAAIFIIQSPQALSVNRRSFTDSSVFRYIGQSMTLGEMPYRDIFDHKGILLYIINMVGYLIHPTYGIWVLEWMTIFATLLFSFRLFQKVTMSKATAAIATAGVYALLTYFYDGGNLTEEYALPFITIGMCVFIDYFITDRIVSWKIVITGICFGLVLLLRPNEAGMWVTYCAAVFVQNVYRKDYVRVLRCIGLFVSGIALGMLPFLGYMWKKGILRECYECYILFNFQYTKQGATINEMLAAVADILSGTGVFLLGCLGIVFLILLWRGYRALSYRMLFLSVCNYVVNLALIAISGRGYGHYGIILLPALCGLLAMLLWQIKELCVRKEWSLQKSRIAVLGLLLVFFMPALVRTVHNVKEYTQAAVEEPFDYMLTYAIRNNVAPGDEIIVLGNYCTIYLETGKQASVRYAYQSEDVLYDERSVENFVESIEQSYTSAIVMNTEDAFVMNTLWPAMQGYVESTFYSAYEDDENILYIRK